MRVFVDERLSIALTDTRDDGVASIVARAVEEGLGNKLIDDSCEVFADGDMNPVADGLPVADELPVADGLPVELNECIVVELSIALIDGAGNDVTSGVIDSKGVSDTSGLIVGTGEELINILADERHD